MAVNYPSPYDLGVYGSLSGEQRQYLNAAYNRGLSANAAQNELIGTPLGLRRQDLQAAYRAIGAIRDTSFGINNTPGMFFPSPTLFIPQQFPIGGNYRVWGYVDGVDSETGESVRLHAVFTFEEQMSVDNLRSGLATIMDKGYQSHGVNFLTNDIIITTAESNLQ